MSAGGRRRRGGGHGHEEVEHENEERWLLTYADMITLLLALFMVLFAISSVNTSKFESLAHSLQEAFSGKIVEGGPKLIETGGEQTVDQSSPEPPLPAIKPLAPPIEVASEEERAAAERENEEFRELKKRIDAYARQHGLEDVLNTEIRREGLVIRLLTDRVLFASGSADLQAPATPLLEHLARVLVAEVRHPITVEGHTDSRPISSARFPTNWELSTARATSVVRFFIDHRVRAGRLRAAGVAAEDPMASNESASGRARNRRVEIVLVRLNGGGQAAD